MVLEAHSSIKATIIINNYNYGRFLAAAIESALNQTYADTEVVVVDDGSTDNSRQIIAGYGNRIRPVLKTNGGQASAFNAGFAASTGDVICMLDSDDLFYPNKVERIAKNLRVASGDPLGLPSGMPRVRGWSKKDHAPAAANPIHGCPRARAPRQAARTTGSRDIRYRAVAAAARPYSTHAGVDSDHGRQLSHLPGRSPRAGCLSRRGSRPPIHTWQQQLYDAARSDADAGARASFNCPRHATAIPSTVDLEQPHLLQSVWGLRESALPRSDL